MNHTEKPVHTALRASLCVRPKHRLLLVSDELSTNHLYMVCEQLTNPVHIYKHLVCELYASSLVCKCVPSFKRYAKLSLKLLGILFKIVYNFIENCVKFF